LHDYHVSAVTSSQEGILASGGLDSKINVREIRDPKKGFQMQLDLGCINSICFSRDGEEIFVTGSRNKLQVLNIGTKKATLFEDIACVLMDRKHDLIITGNVWGTIAVYQKSLENKIWAVDCHKATCCSLFLNRKNHLLVSGSLDQDIVVIDIVN